MEPRFCSQGTRFPMPAGAFAPSASGFRPSPPVVPTDHSGASNRAPDRFQQNADGVPVERRQDTGNRLFVPSAFRRGTGESTNSTACTHAVTRTRIFVSVLRGSSR